MALTTTNLQTWLAESAAASLDEVSSELPQGAYTTFRTFDRKNVLHLDEHLSRLEESAHWVGFQSTLDRTQIRAAIREAISNFADGEVRIRLTLDLEKEPGTVYISLEPLNVPADDQYQNGVRIVTRRMQRNNPRAKLTGFIGPAIGLRRELSPGVVEVAMVDEDGKFLEGLSSNLFAVKDDTVWTADKGVLPGITRSLVLEGVKQLGFSLRLEGYPYAQMDELDEAFITSSTRAVLPVIRIDDVIVGSGKPGKITQILLKDYLDRLGREIQPI